MKTTSKASVEKKLAELVTEKKITKSSIVYGWIKELAAGKKEFRPVYKEWSSWEKNYYLVDKLTEMTTILNAMKIEYKSGNDAPRGGQTSALIQITTKVK